MSKLSTIEVHDICRILINHMQIRSAIGEEKGIFDVPNQFVGSPIYRHKIVQQVIDKLRENFIVKKTNHPFKIYIDWVTPLVKHDTKIEKPCTFEDLVKKYK